MFVALAPKAVAAEKRDVALKIDAKYVEVENPKGQRGIQKFLLLYMGGAKPKPNCHFEITYLDLSYANTPGLFDMNSDHFDSFNSSDVESFACLPIGQGSLKVSTKKPEETCEYVFKYEPASKSRSDESVTGFSGTCIEHDLVKGGQTVHKFTPIEEESLEFPLNGRLLLHGLSR